MKTQSADFVINEGVITLPEGWQDRTVNVFTPPDGCLPVFNISRDALENNETLNAYIDRQLALMQQHITGWQLAGRQPCVLGSERLTGENIHTRYQRDNQPIWQQQAVFSPDNRLVLVFTMTANAALTAADNATFQAMLGSFRLHA